jgi:HAD superfamily hydrolase (TIGR01509 family)
MDGGSPQGKGRPSENGRSSRLEPVRVGPNPSPFRVVAMDAMGVLYRSADDVTELLIPYARARGSRLGPERIHELYVQCSLGRMTSSELWKRLGTNGADDEEYCRGHELTEGVLPAFERLNARGVRLACLSNDVSEWSLLLRRRFGLDKYVSTWVISGDIGVRKPSAEAYATLSRAVGIDPGQILFVDDRMANVRAARAAGLASVLYGAAGSELDEDGQRTVRRMDALEEALDQ